MDFASVLNEINTWPVGQRLELVYAVWDQVGEAAIEELPDEVKAELDRRLEAEETSPDEGLSWEEVERFARGQS